MTIISVFSTWLVLASLNQSASLSESVVFADLVYLTNCVLSLGTAAAVELVVMHSGKRFVVKILTGKSLCDF